MIRLNKLSYAIADITTMWYNVRCHFKPYNRIIVSNLPKTWRDRDELMFHAMFQILVDFVELEQPFKHWNQPAIKRHTDRMEMAEFLKYIQVESGAKAEKSEEIFELYEWYVDKLYERDDSKDTQLPVIELLKKEEAHSKMCDEMLYRILKIRNFLWT